MKKNTDSSQAEQALLGCFLLDPTRIELAIEAGVKSDFFSSVDRQTAWNTMLKLRTSGGVVDMPSLALELGATCPFNELMACEKAAPTGANFKKALSRVVESHGITNLRPALNDLLSKIDDGEPYEAVKSTLEALPSLLRPSEAQEHTLPQIVDEASLWAKEQMAGGIQHEKVVVTGFPRFDDHATPIQMHEYCIVGARTSVGKSSFMAQLCNHNLNRGLRCAYFTLETSARAVCLQIAAQRAKTNLRLLRHEMPDRQKRLNDELAKLREQPLLVFEKDLALEQIEARCRLLATSFKPDVVFIDYLGLIKIKAEGQYERMTKLSKAMIPLKKSLGCALVVAAQLNRGNEKDDRPPTRTDFRDTGSIEEDAARVICLHRPTKDDSGMLQGYDRTDYLTEIYQLKLRDGPLTQGRLTFHAGHTLFEERQ